MLGVVGLIGGASNKELTEKLHDKGYSVALVVGSEGEKGTDIADFVLTTDLRNYDTIKSFLGDLNVNYLLVGTGHRLAFLLAENLELDGIIPNINIKASRLAKEKRKFKDFIVKKGILTPQYISIEDKKHNTDVNDIVDKLGLPCVVKATIDTMLPQKIHCKNELVVAIDEVLASGSPVVIEEFIRGIDCTVFVSVEKNAVKALPICYYSKAEDNEMKGFSNDEYIKQHLTVEGEARVKALCEQLVIICGFEGLPRVDLMVLPTGEAYVLEANSVGVTGVSERHAPYCKGTVLALREQGIDVAEIVVDNALSKWMNIQ